MEKEIKKINNLMGKPERVKEKMKSGGKGSMVRSGNVIEFQNESRGGIQKSGRSAGNIVKGLGRPDAKINFLNDQLGNARNELSLFRQNHNALVEQIVFVQKDFRRRLRAATSDKKISEEQLKKVSAAHKIKEKELFLNERKLEELKIELNTLHASYSEKLNKFKEQHKTRIEDRERAAGKKYKAALIDKQRLEKSVNYLMDIVHQKTEKISSAEGELQGLKKKTIDLTKENETLEIFKKENTFAVESVNKELDFVRNDLELVTKEYKEKEKEISVLRFKIKNLKEDAVLASDKNEELQRKVLRIKGELDSKTYRLTEYQKTIDDLRKNNVDSNKLADEIRDYQISKTNLENDLGALQIKYDEAKVKLSGHEKELESYKIKISELKVELSTSAAVRAKLTEIEKIEQRQAQDIISYKKGVAELRLAVESRENKIDGLNSILEKVEGEKEELEEECASLESHISDISNELKLASEQNQISLASINGLNEKVTALSTEILDSKEEKEELEGEVGRLQVDIETEQAKFESLDAEMKVLQSELEDARKKEADFIEAQQEWNDEREAFELRIGDFSADLEDRESEISKKQKEIERSFEVQRTLESDLEKLKAEKRSVEQLNMALVKEQEQLTAKSESGAFSKERIEIDLKESAEENSRLQAKIVDAEKKNFSLTCEIETLEKKIAESSAAPRTEEEEKAFRAELADLHKQKEDLRVENEGYKKEVEDLRESLQKFEVGTEAINASEEVKQNLDEKMEELEAREFKFKSEMEKRREELNFYSRWVDSQKESLKKHIVRFSQEMKLSMSINPINSYLAMTKKELSKVQVLLSKPGIVGIQRTYLEDHFELLTEQKKYVEELVSTAEADVEKRANELTGLLKQGEFIPVPPLPPKK